MNSFSSSKFANIYFDTLGCAKNSCDTDKMIKDVLSFGFNVVENPEKANVIVLNTCAFIEIATQESIDTFFEYRNFYKDKKIIVVGCLPSRYGSDLEKSLNEADGFLPCKKEDDLPKLIESFGFFPENICPKQNSKTFAYVKISEGCNRRCSYCMIPKIRGEYESVQYSEIKKDVFEKISNGASEIILVAQDCGVWGRDLSPKLNLSYLLDNLSSEFENIYFRILYIGPDGINKELLELINSKNNLINYLDIPLQHCNKKILQAMNRPGSEDEYLRTIDLVREIVPDCTLRTTFMVGFPGETDSQFEELCNFTKSVSFDYAGCFEYSNEEGSASAKFDKQVSDEIKHYRTNILREILDTISLDKLNSLIGKTYPIIIEGFEEGRYFGRAPFQAPEVDGLTFISKYQDKKICIGDKLNVKICDTEAYDLVGRVVNYVKN